MQEKKKKKATVKDVAAKANTSITTVSRVLSGSDYPVKEELKAAILEAAKALNYKPNVFGQLLRGGMNRQIGVVIPSITNPFYSQLIAAVQKECMDNDYVPILYSSHNSLHREQSYIDMLIQSQVAGALLSLIHWDESIGKALDEAGIPYVLFDQPHDDDHGAAVDFDFYSAGKMAAEYLIRNGHQEIVFASGTIDRPSRKKLFAGFRDQLEQCGIAFREEDMLLYSTKERTGASAMKDYQCGQELGRMVLEMEYIPDALFTVNDMMAIGIIKELETHGVHVPADISILGFDNVEFGEMIVPALTTISQSAYRTGELAVNLLFEQFEGRGLHKKKVLLEPVLIERDSVRKKHNKIRRSQI